MNLDFILIDYSLLFFLNEVILKRKKVKLFIKVYTIRKIFKNIIFLSFFFLKFLNDVLNRIGLFFQPGKL